MLSAEARGGRLAPRPGLRLAGFDGDAFVLRQGRANAERAGVGTLIHLGRRALGALRARYFAGDKGLVVTNPPWGERLEEQQRAGWLYYALGQMLGRLAPHWQALVVASQAETLDRCGMP